MDALDRLTALTVRLGDVVLVEEAAFPPVLDLLDTVGAEVVGGRRSTTRASCPTRCRPRLARRPVAVYLQPRAHNPLGVSIGAGRAGGAGRRCWRRRGAWVFEDDHAGDISTSPLVSLGRHLPARTVHVQSFSKSYGPDLRLAAVGGPDDLRRRAGGPPPARRRLVEPPAAGGAARAARPIPPPPRRWPTARARLRRAPRRPASTRSHARGVGDDRPGRHQPVGRGGRRAGRGLPPGHQRRRRRRRLAVRAGRPRRARPHPHHVGAPAGTRSDRVADLVAEAAAPPTPRTRGW